MIGHNHEISERILVTVADLCYTDYSWPPLDSDDPKISGEPDHHPVNIMAGPEVVFIINKYASIHNLKDKSDARKIEIMLREELPNGSYNQIEVMNWIKENW